MKSIYLDIAIQVRKEIVNKYGKDFLNGKCIEASERIVQILSENNIKASTVEGWVQYDDSIGCSDRDYDEHTWVETEDGCIIDVTATQFNAFMDKNYPDIIISEELPHGYSYDEPQEELEDDSGMNWLDESLFEHISTIEYKDISDLDHYKKSANDILGGYGDLSDNSILDRNKEVYIDGELKGYIGLSEYQEDDGTKLLGIGNFMILERGKGYGTQVINDLVSKYKNEFDLIYCFVDADNTGAISLYKKLGKVYDEDGPNDNGQYYVTFYDNGKYKLEEDFNPNSIIAYHGSNAKFNKFDLKYFGRTDDGMWGKGVYFTNDKDIAMGFGSNYLYTCRLTLTNPYIIDNKGTESDNMSDGAVKYLELTDGNNAVLQSMGYDGIISLNEEWVGSYTTIANQYIVFNPDNIEILDVKDLNLEEDMVSENLTEAKKRKKKKRQKPSFGWWSTFNPNAGNVEYNNAFFNHVMGNTSTGEFSDATASAEMGGDCGGMGESYTNSCYKKVNQLKLESYQYINKFNILDEARKFNLQENKQNVCVICGQEFDGYGHNAMPLKSGKCCDKCNMEHVIPERLLITKMTQNKELDTLANKVREALIEGGIKPKKVLIFPNRPMISFLIEGRRDVEHSLADFLVTGYLDNNIYDYEISMQHESNQKNNLVAWHQYKIIWGKEI